jgi:tRNA pseudouridine55 synthase
VKINGDFVVAERRFKRKKGRNVSGIVLLDKPVGITSNKALQQVKTLFNAQKAGHTGSLDPVATGLLPICLGEATKISQFLLTADKTYLADLKLGIKTNSGDSEGKIIHTRPVNVQNLEQIKQVLERYKGNIEQIPPMHSALKKNGVPLYKLAHQGIEVDREPRTVTIFDLQLVSFTDDVLQIRVHCSKGTYIRTLADDIGEDLGCGAHISQLRREQVGPFACDSMYTIAQLEELAAQGHGALDEVLLPIDQGLTQWPRVNLTADMAFYLQQGQPVFVPKVKEQGLLRLYLNDEEFLGVGQILDDGRVAPKRLMKNIKIG